MKYFVMLFLTSCTHVYSSSCLYTPIPQQWRAPLQKQISPGFYDCGSKIAQCVSKKDILTMIENKANMEEAQRQLVKLIDDMNAQVVEVVHCGFLDVSCRRKEKEKQSQSLHTP